MRILKGDFERIIKWLGIYLYFEIQCAYIHFRFVHLNTLLPWKLWPNYGQNVKTSLILGRGWIWKHFLVLHISDWPIGVKRCRKWPLFDLKIPNHTLVHTIRRGGGKSVIAFSLHVEGCVFKFKSHQTYVVKTGTDNSTAKRLAICVSVTGPRKWPF